MAARQRATIAYTTALAGRAPQVVGEVPLTTAPPLNLQHPDETIGVGNLVVRARYWTAPGSPDSVYRSFKRSAVAGLKLTGYGRPSSSAEDLQGRGFVHFDPTSTPSYVDASELYVEMESGANGRTVIAAFGEVAPHPIRIAAETIPVSRSTVTITRRRTERPSGTVRSVALDAQQSEVFVRAFNTSPVRSGGCIGGTGPAFGYVIAIVSGSRTWQVTYPGGANCGGFGVMIGTQSLPDLEPTGQMRHLINDDYLRGKGYIEGSLGAVGGPTASGLRGLERGTVMVIKAGQVVARTTVEGQLGNFELEVPPGRYTLTGRSPKYEGGHGVCRGYKAVTVKPDGSAYVNVLCQER
ncbi:MAG TPA: hypothetical protein VHV76_10930 [Mycobacteriales bacterium]|nr:hypothetical protein [Mycobacteriales bacterium]